MSFIPQLNSTQLNTLRGNGGMAPSYYSGAYVSVVPNQIIFQALVNQSVFSASYAQVIYDTVSIGAYTDIVEGMRVFITPTTDLTNALRTGFTGRARLNSTGVVATLTILYVNESSTSIQNNWVITVIDDYPLLDRLGRQVGGVQFIDYNISFHKPKPIIYNLRSAYAGWVTNNVYTVDFVPLGLAVASGAAISSWLWTVKDGTITSGSSTTQNITATFPPGFRWVYVRVTDSNGSTRTRRIPVWAHDPDLYPPVPLQVGDLSVSGGIEGGYSASMTAWAGVENILDNTYMAFWSDEVYQDFNGSLLGDNINFVGRFRQSNDTSTPDLDVGQIAETRYTIEGVMQQLARIEMLPYELDNAAIATSFFQIVNLTAWRSVCEMLSNFSTFLELHSLSFDSMSNAFLALGLRTQNGNILAVVNDLYNSIDGGMQINPAGEAQFVRDLRMLSASARNAAPTVINFDTRDMMGIDDYSHDNVRTVGRLKSTGGMYISATNQYAVFESLAPGVAQDYPEGSQSLDRQILQANQSATNAQIEINTRAGYAFARAQSSDKISVTHPDGYHSILVPSLDTWYTFTLDGSETVRGIILTTATRWLLTSIEIDHNGQEGEKTVRATYTIETTGAAGQSVVYPASPSDPYTDPSFPPFPSFPAFPVPPIYLPPDGSPPPYTGDPTNQATAPGDGNTVLIVDMTDNVIRITTNYITGGTYPTWVDITPPNGIGLFMQHAVFIPDSTAVYALYHNGADSTFCYCANPLAAPPVWIETPLSGLFTMIAAGGTAGQVYIKGSNTAGSILWDLTTDTHGGVIPPPSGTAIHGFGSFTASGIQSSTIKNGSYFMACGWSGGGYLHVMSLKYHFSMQIRGVGEDFFFSGPVSSLGAPTSDGADGTGWYYQWSFVDEDLSTISFEASAQSVWYCDYIEWVYGAGGNSITTRYSSDFGSTFSAVETATPIPSLGSGLDAIKIGNVALLGADTHTQIATSGGAWTPYGTQFPIGAQPNGIIIPRYQFGSLGNNISTSTPQYLAASGTLGVDAGALWKVTSSGSLFTDITPHYGGYPGLLAGTFAGAITMPYLSGSRILEVANYNGVPRLSVTVNTGANWKFSQPLYPQANYVRVRKNDLQMKQAYLTNGSLAMYCSDYSAATIVFNTKVHPGGNLRSIEVYN